MITNVFMYQYATSPNPWTTPVWKTICPMAWCSVRLRQATCIVRKRKLRLYKHVARLTQDPAHWILTWEDPRGRPHLLWLRHESYLKVKCVAGLASAWAMTRRRSHEYRREGGRGDPLLPRMPPYLTWPSVVSYNACHSMGTNYVIVFKYFRDSSVGVSDQSIHIPVNTMQ